jgi:hypothetical protein
MEMEERMRIGIGVTALGALLASSSVSGLSAATQETCDVARSMLENFCSRGRMTERTQAGCEALSDVVGGACEDVETGFPTPYWESGIIPDVLGGPVGPVTVTDILLNAPNADVTLALSVAEECGGEAPDAPTIVVEQGKQLSIDLTTPIVVPDGQQLCFSVPENNEANTVVFSVLGRNLTR